MENHIPLHSQQYSLPPLSSSAASSSASSTSISSGTLTTDHEEEFNHIHRPMFVSRNNSSVSTRSIGNSMLSGRSTSTAEEEEEERGGNVFDDRNAVGEEGDGFTTPSNSRPPSSIGSSFMGVADGFGGGYGGGGGGVGPGGMGMGMMGMGAGTSSSARYSYLPQQPPMAVIDGGRPGYARHAPSFSITRSETPSSEFMEGAPSLNRSDTVGTNRTTTSNSSHLYSIPSRLSQISSPPSPLPPMARVQPRMNYSQHHHQQTLSIGSGHSARDPFVDNYTEPDMDMVVGNGFAPHRQGTYVPQMMMARPESSGTAQTTVTTATLPPPYCQYPGTAFPKDNDRHGGLAVASGAAVGMAGANGMVVNRANAASVAGHYAPGGPDNMSDVASHRSAVEGESIDASGALKEWKESRLSPRWYLWIIASILVGLAVGLGAGLGIGLHQKSSAHDGPTKTITATSDDHTPTSEQTEDPKFEYAQFPPIPIGPAVISPLKNLNQEASCELESMSADLPPFFQTGAGSGIWSCKIPDDKPLLWNILPLPPNLSGAQINSLKSDPKPLSHVEWDDGTWGGYIVTSKEGEEGHKDHVVYVDDAGDVVQYAGPVGWREGLQGPAFWRQPLTFLNGSIYTNTFTKVKVDRSYNFGILYDKTVIIRERTLQAGYENPKFPSKTGDGSKLLEGDVVWMCIWEKTLLEVEIDIDFESKAAARDIQKDSTNAWASLESLFDLDSMPTTVTVGPSMSMPTASSASSYSTPQPPPPAPATTTRLPEETDEEESTDLDAAIASAVASILASATATATVKPPPPYGPPVLPPPPPAPAILYAAAAQAYQAAQAAAVAAAAAAMAAAPPFSNSTLKRRDLGTNSTQVPSISSSPTLSIPPSPITSPTAPIRTASVTARAVPPVQSGVSVFSRCVKIKEYHPSLNRLKDVQGIDRTEGDNDPRARLGSVKCTRMVVTKGGGLRPIVNDKGEKVEVKFKRKLIEEGTANGKAKCRCEWVN